MASKKKRPKIAQEGRAGGPATFSGTDMQASIGALVAAHILARQRLNWLSLDVPDVPIALQGETLGPGDDLRIEFADTPKYLEIQSKKGLQKGPRLSEAFEAVALRLPGAPDAFVAIAVDSASSARSIREELKRDLRRIAQGRRDQLKGITLHVESILSSAGADKDLLRKVSICTLDLAHKGEADAARGILILRMILEDKSHAEAVWDLLIRECGVICRDQGRLSLSALESLLTREGFPLAKPRTVGEENAAASVSSSPQPYDTTSIADQETSVDERVTLFQTLIDSAKDLIDRGQETAAITVLRDVEKRFRKSHIPPSSRSVLFGRLGVAHLRSGQPSEARRALTRALEYDSNNVAALINSGVLEFTDGRPADALVLLDRAVAISPDSPTAWSNRTAVAAVLGVPNAPPESVRQNAIYLSGLASFALKAGQWSLAALHAQEALRFARSSDALMAYAIARYNDSQDARIEGSPVSAARQAALREVIDITSEAINELETGLHSKQLADALILRGMANRTLNDVHAAEVDLQKALGIAPGNAEAAYQLSIVRAKQRDWIGMLATSEMGSAGTQGERARLMVMRARALLELERREDIGGVLDDALQWARGTDQEIEVRTNGADIAIEAGDLRRASALVAGISDPSEQWIVHLWRARIAAKDGQHEAAETEFGLAMDASLAPSDKRTATAEFAVYLARRGDVKRAVNLFEAASVDESAPEEWRRVFAMALYDADELAKAEAFIRELRDRGPLPAWALHVEWRLAVRQADLPRQVTALENLCFLNADDIEAAIQLADVYLSSGRRQESIDLVDRAASVSTLTSPQLVHLADLSARLGRPTDAVRLVYEALRRDPDNPLVHLAFVNSMIRAEGESVEFKVDEVQANTAVRLETESKAPESYLYVLLDRDSVDTSHNEYNTLDSRVSDLHGKKVGDSIVRRPGALSEEKLVIKEITHIYVHTFREVMLGFSKRFPENTALQRFHIGDSSVDDFAPLIRSATNQSRRAEVAIRLHMEQFLPLGAVSKIAGSNTASLLDELTSSRNRRVNVERGGKTQLEASLIAARSTQPVVLTRSGLYTVQTLGLLELFGKVFETILYSQSLLEEIKSERDELWHSRETGLKHMIAGDQGIRFIETTPEQIRFAVDLRDSLMSWVAENALLKPRPVTWAVNARDKLRETLGDSDFDALALTAHEGGVLFADDVGLRELSANESGAGGFSTYSFVTSSAADGQILNDQRDAAILALISQNHYFIPLSADLLLFALARSGYTVDGAVLRVIDRLADESLVLEFAVDVVAELLRTLSTTLAGAGALRSVTLATLEALARNRDAAGVAHMVERAARRRLVLLPIPLDQVLGAIQAFVQSRVGFDSSP